MKLEDGAGEGGKKAYAGKAGHRRPRGKPVLPSLASLPAGPAHTHPRTTGRGPLTRWCTFGPMEPPFPERHGQGVHGFSLLLKMEENAITGSLPGGHSPFCPSWRKGSPRPFHAPALHLSRPTSGRQGKENFQACHRPREVKAFFYSPKCHPTPAPSMLQYSLPLSPCHFSSKPLRLRSSTQNPLVLRTNMFLHRNHMRQSKAPHCRMGGHLTPSLTPTLLLGSSNSKNSASLITTHSHRNSTPSQDST